MLRAFQDGIATMDAAGVRVELPTRRETWWFEARAWLQRLRRMAADGLRGPRRHARGSALADAPVLAESVSALWPQDETAQHLVAGKIHNLRRAVSGLHGVVVPAGRVFGFWRQVGRATAGTGMRLVANCARAA